MRRDIEAIVSQQRGIIFATPAIVHREQYSGRDIIAKNSAFASGYTDGRGYVPVEWWIMSITEAENAKKKDGEGLTMLQVGKQQVSLQAANEEMHFFNPARWPLTKILDIGGEPRETSFGSREVPPIPPHVHSGNVIDGKMTGPGKLEAYFFPPTEKIRDTVITRLGVKKGVTKDDVKQRLTRFGKDDSMYELLQEYVVRPYDCWTIPAGTLHAPGPWVTVEIQLPQDDFNLAGWRLAERTSDRELYETMVLRGLKDEEEFAAQAINWETTSDNDFEKNNRRTIEVLAQGAWGRRYRIFFGTFYGEGWEIKAGHEITFEKRRAVGGVLWEGSGLINGNHLGTAQREFLSVAHNIHIAAERDLTIFTVEEMRDERHN